MALLWSINQSNLIYKAQTHNTKASRNTLAQSKRKPADPSRATWSHSGKEQQKKFYVGRNLEQIPSLHSLHENFSSKRVVKGYMETHKVTWFTAPPASTEQCTKLPSKGINVNISWSLKRKRKAIIDQTILQSKKITCKLKNLQHILTHYRIQTTMRSWIMCLSFITWDLHWTCTF